MKLSQFYTRTSYALGGTDEESPEHGSEEATMWLSILNQKIEELAEDLTKQWRFTFKETAPNEPGTVATTGTTTLTGTSTNFLDYAVGDTITVSGETVRTIATITSDTVLTVTVAFSNTASSKTFTHATIIASGVETYKLHRKFLGASDSVYVTTTGGERVYFDLIQPQERKTTVQQVFLSDENPETINFANNIESTDEIVGGTLTVPGYYTPEAVSAVTDDLPVPSPNWCVYIVAAEVAGADIVYEDREGNLNAKANSLYSMMVKRNRRGTFDNPRKSPYNVKRIRSTEVE